MGKMGKLRRVWKLRGDRFVNGLLPRGRFAAREGESYGSW